MWSRSQSVFGWLLCCIGRWRTTIIGSYLHWININFISYFETHISLCRHLFLLCVFQRLALGAALKDVLFHHKPDWHDPCFHENHWSCRPHTEISPCGSFPFRSLGTSWHPHGHVITSLGDSVRDVLHIHPPIPTTSCFGAWLCNLHSTVSTESRDYLFMSAGFYLMWVIYRQCHSHCFNTADELLWCLDIYIYVTIPLWCRVCLDKTVSLPQLSVLYTCVSKYHRRGRSLHIDSLRVVITTWVSPQ